MIEKILKWLSGNGKSNAKQQNIVAHFETGTAIKHLQTQLNKPVITTTILTLSGERVELPLGKVLTDGSCIICDDDFFYHTTVSCESCGYNQRLVNVDYAKSKKLTYCYKCSRDMYELGKWYDNRGEGDNE